MTDADVLADAAAATNNNFNTDDILTSSLLGGAGSEFPLSDIYTKNSIAGISGGSFDIPSIETFPSIFDSNITQGGSVFGEVITDYSDLLGFQGAEVEASVNLGWGWFGWRSSSVDEPHDLGGYNDEGFKNGLDIEEIINGSTSGSVVRQLGQESLPGAQEDEVEEGYKEVWKDSMQK